MVPNTLSVTNAFPPSAIKFFSPVVCDHICAFEIQFWAGDCDDRVFHIREKGVSLPHPELDNALGKSMCLKQ